jgi:drug/metabolite transporter (DMT)-like permease
VKYWIMFIVLAVIWGSSFLLIKVGLAPDGTIPAEVGRFDPVSLAATRLTIAAVCYMGFVLITRASKIPRDARTWSKLAIEGFFNNVVPFILISWSEKYIDSGLASVLNATVPLFALTMAHFALNDDRFTLGKIFGIAGGFAGVALLATRSTPLHPNPIEGQIAVVVASLSYAFAGVYMRRVLRGLDPYVTGATSISIASLMMIVIVLVGVRPLPDYTALNPEALRAVVTLGIVNTFVAYLLFFTIMPVWGVSRTTMVTYVSPAVAIALGALFANEIIDAKLLIGAGLIIGGVILANFWKAPLNFGRSQTAATVEQAEATAK